MSKDIQTQGMQNDLGHCVGAGLAPPDGSLVPGKAACELPRPQRTEVCLRLHFGVRFSLARMNLSIILIRVNSRHVFLL